MSFLLILELCRELLERPDPLTFGTIAAALATLNLDELHALGRELGLLACGATYRQREALEALLRDGLAKGGR